MITAVPGGPRTPADIFTPNTSSQLTRSQQSAKAFGDDGFTFGDLIDIVNPLQHIPVISHFYRQLTGDTIDPAARIAGGALFGGALGAVFSVASTVLESSNSQQSDEQDLPSLQGDGVEPGTALAVNAEQSGVIQGHSLPVDTATADGHVPSISPKALTSQMRPGGWVVKAAYRGKEHLLHIPSQTNIATHMHSNPDDSDALTTKTQTRPGGWIVNAAYQGKAYSSHTVGSVDNAGVEIDITT